MVDLFSFNTKRESPDESVNRRLADTFGLTMSEANALRRRLETDSEVIVRKVNRVGGAIPSMSTEISKVAGLTVEQVRYAKNIVRNAKDNAQTRGRLF